MDLIRSTSTAARPASCIGVGRLWGKLQSLEVTLRLFLTQAKQPKNYITNRDTFGPLVKKYNGQLSKDE
jgi:hypothetical protein